MHIPGPRIAVIGAGWAGLTCARLLQDRGIAVRLFEATRQLGGRARGLDIDLNGDILKLDNGQHLVIGAYRCLRGLLARYSNEQHHTFRPPDFMIRELVPNKAQSRFPRLAAPPHLSSSAAQHERRMFMGQATWVQGIQAGFTRQAMASLEPGRTLALGLAQLSWLAGARAMPFQSLIELAMLLRRAYRHPPRASCSLDEWLDGLRLRQALVRRWVDALCESALNCPSDQACALRFTTVLNEAMANPQLDASHWMHQRCDLGELLALPLARGRPESKHDPQFGPLDIRRGARVLSMASKPVFQHVEQSAGSWWLKLAGQETLDGPYEHIVLALEPQRALALTQQSLAYAASTPHRHRAIQQGLERLQDDLRALPKPLGILTRWLCLPKPTEAAQVKPQLLLRDRGPAAWLFPNQRDVVDGAQQASKASRTAGLVISAQHDAIEARRQADEIQRQFGIQAIDYKDIYEHHAATPSRFGLHWPPFNRFSDQGIWLAGDWIADGSQDMLPACLESALRSATACATALGARFQDAHSASSA